jgi:hypothetical protein
MWIQLCGIEEPAFIMGDYNDPLGIVEEIIKTGIEIPLTKVSSF